MRWLDTEELKRRARKEGLEGEEAKIWLRERKMGEQDEERAIRRGETNKEREIRLKKRTEREMDIFKSYRKKWDQHHLSRTDKQFDHIRVEPKKRLENEIDYKEFVRKVVEAEKKIKQGQLTNVVTANKGKEKGEREDRWLGAKKKN